MRPNGSDCRWQSIPPATTPSHFFKVILSSTIEDKELSIPPKFVRKFGDELSAVTTLRVANGRIWQVGLTKAGNEIYFHDGWHEFVEYHSIRHGHFLVFNYLGNSSFNVLLFDETACEIEYPFYAVSSGQEANNDMQHPAVSEGIMEDEDSVEIIGFKTDLKKRGYKQGSKKQSMNKRYNPLLKQDCVNGYLTRSKKYKVDDQVEIVDLDVKESSQGKTREREMCNTHGLLLDKTKAQQQNQYQNAKLMQVPVHDHKGTGSGPSDIDLICSCGNIHVQSKNGEPKKNFGEQEEVTGKCEDGLEIIVSKRFFLWYPKRSQDRKRAIRAVKLFKPISPSFLVILRQHCAIRTELLIPAAFTRKYFSEDSKQLTLQNSQGKEWLVQIYRRRGKTPEFSKGWHRFSMDNNLEEGDVCVFELIKPNVLKVSICHVSKTEL